MKDHGYCWRELRSARGAKISMISWELKGLGELENCVHAVEGRHPAPVGIGIPMKHGKQRDYKGILIHHLPTGAGFRNQPLHVVIR